MPLPLGYSYLTAVSGAKNFNAKTIASSALLLCTEDILHQDIPSDPNDPSIPHPDYFDNFVMAIGLGNPNWPLDDDGNPDIHGELGPGWQNNTPDRKPNWTYILPEDTSFISVVRQAYSWYKNYGPIPEDQELETPFYGDWGSHTITKERWVYFYILEWEGPSGGMANSIIRGISSMDLVVQIQGLEGNEWILPEKWGETLPYLYKRGPNDWQAKYNFNRWTLENGQAIAAVCIAVMSAIITTVTLGAGAVTIAFGAALIAGMSAVIKAGLSGNTAGIVAGIAQMGAAAIQAGQDSKAFDNMVKDLSKATNGKSDAVVGWVNDVAKPFSTIYQKIEEVRKQLGTAGAYLSTIKIMGNTLPVINEDYWKKATDPAYLGPFAFWAKKAKNFNTEDELMGYITGLPWYAQDIAGFGSAIRAAEIARINASVEKHVKASASFTNVTLTNKRNVGIARIPSFMSSITQDYKPVIGSGNENTGTSPPISTPKKVAIGVGAGFVIWKLIGLFL